MSSHGNSYAVGKASGRKRNPTAIPYQYGSALETSLALATPPPMFPAVVPFFPPSCSKRQQQNFGRTVRASGRGVVLLNLSRPSASAMPVSLVFALPLGASPRQQENALVSTP